VPRRDRNLGDVKLVGIKNGVLRAGQQVVLTRNSSADFADIEPASAIATRQTLKARLTSDITAYISEFSIISALRRGDLYQRLARTAAGRSALERILRSAACLQIAATSHGPYSIPRSSEREN